MPSPSSISTLLKEGVTKLNTSPILQPNAKLETEIILSTVLKRSKEFIFMYPDFDLTGTQVAEFRKLIDSRSKFEPISYLVGEKEFYSRKFYVNNSVLIPRPESELLIETTITRLTDGKDNNKVSYTVADLGTGSGCLAITLALEMKTKHMDIWAFDNSNKALEVARNNWDKLKASTNNGISTNQIRFAHLDYVKNPLPERFDIIIANPPYIPTPELATLPLDVKEFEPWAALDGGDDGLTYYKRIRKLLQNHLKPNGFAVIELHTPNAAIIKGIFINEYALKVLPDLAGNERCLLVIHN